jgi:hypothetical protein
VVACGGRPVFQYSPVVRQGSLADNLTILAALRLRCLRRLTASGSRLASVWNSKSPSRGEARSGGIGTESYSTALEGRPSFLLLMSFLSLLTAPAPHQRDDNPLLMNCGEQVSPSQCLAKLPTHPDNVLRPPTQN